MASDTYIQTIYNEAEKPKTDYPSKLIAYLCKRFSLQAGTKLLEPGCGRGDFLLAFKDAGFQVYGLDQSSEIFDLIHGVEIKVADIEKDTLPYPDNFFDVVYSKSLVEHLYHPDRYFTEAYRILKPGGKLITLVPDWESNYKIYFDDFTHRTPFTTVSLRDLYLMTGYQNVDVARFRQLPMNWKFPFLNLISAVTALFTPVRVKNKFLRWSRELMVIGIGEKIL